MQNSCPCGFKNESEFMTEYRHLCEEDEACLGKMEIRRCLGCSLIFAAPSPPLERIVHYYDKVYRKEGRPNFISDPEGVEPGDLERSQYEYMARYVDFSSVNTVLDIGAGYGFLLRELGRANPRLRLFFDDLDSKSTRYLSKYGIRGFDPSRDGRADLVISSHNLEHFTSPEPFFDKVKACLKPGGRLFIEVPNDLFVTEKWAERPHNGPHLLFFSEKSLRFFIEKSGFKVLNTDTCGWSVDTELELLKSEMREFGNRSAAKKVRRAVLDMVPAGIKKAIKQGLLGKKPVDLGKEHFKYGGQRRSIRAMAVLE